MYINKEKNGNTTTIKPVGRLDTMSAPELEKELESVYDGTTELIFDLAGLDYISSAGLRALLSAQKRMSSQGQMIVKGANDIVSEVFEITGFVDILNIQ